METPNKYIADVIGDETPEDDANARLIAAAPDLLAALDDLWLWATEQRIFLGSDPMPEGLSERCEAAIAKAEGRS